MCICRTLSQAFGSLIKVKNKKTCRKTKVSLQAEKNALFY
ncbi:hypothetical protein CHCC20375_0576 [Bacillus licheniformis]|nr:hypothetical protein CHCC20375_0576 [Bacillus licheniformis]